MNPYSTISWLCDLDAEAFYSLLGNSVRNQSSQGAPGSFQSATSVLGVGASMPCMHSPKEESWFLTAI